MEILKGDQVSKFNIERTNEAAPLSRSGSWVLHDLLAILLVLTFRFPSL
jgi:hypothetical protein